MPQQQNPPPIQYTRRELRAFALADLARIESEIAIYATKPYVNGEWLREAGDLDRIIVHGLRCVHPLLPPEVQASIDRILAVRTRFYAVVPLTLEEAIASSVTTTRMNEEEQRTLASSATPDGKDGYV